MSARYPSPTDRIFILCDDIREEAGGKVSLMGVYGPEIVVKVKERIEKKEDSPALASLCFYVVFTDGEGKFEMTSLLTNPQGDKLIELSEKAAVAKEANTWLSFQYKISPFKAIAGVYVLKIALDDHEYESSFELIHKVSN